MPCPEGDESVSVCDGEVLTFCVLVVCDVYDGDVAWYMGVMGLCAGWLWVLLCVLFGFWCVFFDFWCVLFGFWCVLLLFWDVLLVLGLGVDDLG